MPGIERTSPRSEAETRAIFDALERLLGGESLRGAPQLQRLLRHLVQASLAEDRRALKAYTIGTQVLGRGADFDPGADPVVRLEVGRLRRKLLEHHANGGARDPVGFDIPKGGNAVTFTLRTQARNVDGSRSDVAAEGAAPGAHWALVDTLVGRSEELAALAALMARHRMVTVVGPGGIGKTRLALAAAAGYEPVPLDGIHWIDLSPIAAADDVPLAIATGVRLPVGKADPADAIARGLRERRLLLVLDNCEHVAADVARVATAVLRDAPGVRILATSQQPLGVRDEQTYRLDALALPPDGTSPGQAAGYAAVEMLLARAHAADPGLRIDAAVMAGAVAICRRCDGIPLALEMAASRLPLLGVQGLLDSLGRHPGLLRNVHGDAPARQLTLEAAHDWSYSLLSGVEQTALRRLSVFAGSFSLDAGLTVAAAADLQSGVALDAVLSLAQKSLLHVQRGETRDEPSGAAAPPRYRLLFSTRAYASQRLLASPEAADVRTHHALAMQAVAERATARYWVTPAADWLAACRHDHADLQRAFEHACEHGQAAIAAVTADVLLRLETARSPGAVRQRIQAAHRLLALCPDDPLTQARLWNCIAVWNVSSPAPMPYLQAARQRVEAWRRTSQSFETYWSLSRLAAILASSGRVSECEDILREMERIEDPAWPARIRTFRSLSVAHACHHRADPAGLETSARKVQRLGARAGLPSFETLGTLYLARAALLRGRLDDAEALVRRAEEVWQRIGRPLERGQTLLVRFHVALRRGDLDDARAAARAARPLLADNDDTGHLFDPAAWLACRDGDDEEAALLAGCADRWHAAMELVRTPEAEALADEVRRHLAARMDAARLEPLLRRGRELGPASAEELARRTLDG